MNKSWLAIVALIVLSGSLLADDKKKKDKPPPSPTVKPVARNISSPVFLKAKVHFFQLIGRRFGFDIFTCALVCAKAFLKSHANLSGSGQGSFLVP